MTIAAKHLDPLVGLDTHIILIPTPAGPVPTPLPHPYVGILFDPFDYAPFVGASTYINGLPRGVAGTNGKAMPPHIPMGGPFAKPPTNESEIFMGSATVLTDGDPQSFLGLPVLSCQDIGMPAPPRPKKKSVAKTLLLPTTVILCIPMGMLVLIGGPPTISMMAIAQKLGLGALKKFRASKLNRKLSRKFHKLADKGCNKLNLGNRARNLVHKAICTVTGHPVDVATGKVFTDRVDFGIDGPISIAWERTWYSSSTYAGPLGHGWHHSYDQVLYLDDELVLYQTGDGRHIGFPKLAEGAEYFDPVERLTLFRDATGYALRDSDWLVRRFVRVPGRDGAAPLVEISDGTGNRVRLLYDGYGRLAQVVDCSGRVLEVVWDGRQIVALTAPHPTIPGQRIFVARYAYDGVGNMTTAWDALGQPASYAYENHLLVKETDRNGLSFYFAYDRPDAESKCTRTWGDGGIYDHKLTYDTERGITVVENSLGHKTTYFHDGAQVTRIIDALGNVSETEYDDARRVVCETDELGRKYRRSYDERGNLIAAIEPDGAAFKLEMGLNDKPVKGVDAAGGEWKWVREPDGRLLEMHDPLGAVTKYHYRGPRLAGVTDPAGGRIAFEYDELGNATTMVMPDGAVFCYQFDLLGRLIGMIDPLGSIERYELDLLDRIVRMEDADGNTTVAFYDPEGNVVQSKDQNSEITFTYQGVGKVASRSESGTTLRFEYDTEEQLVAITNEHGRVFRFEMGPTGELMAESGFDGILRRYTRDAAGRILRIEGPSDVPRSGQTDENGARFTNYTYDNGDRVTRAVHADGSTEEYQYRQDGELTSATAAGVSVRFELDPLGRVLKETQGRHWVESEYDVLGWRTRLRSSLGADQVVTRDSVGNVLAVTDKGSKYETRFSRDLLGQELERGMPGGLSSRWQRDKIGRPIQHTVEGKTKALRAVGMRWAVDDRLTLLIDATRGVTEFGHDSAGSLVYAKYSDGKFDLRMPDAVSNLFKTHDQTDREYGPAGQLLRARTPVGVVQYQYDAVGNLVEKLEPNGRRWGYVWNGAGMLAKVVRPDGSEVTFVYDALGRRVEKRYRGQVTRWVWDESVPLHEWVEGVLEPLADPSVRPVYSEDAQQKRRDAELLQHLSQGPPERGSEGAPITWVFQPDLYVPIAKLVGGAQYSIVGDHLGTPVLMTDASGKPVFSASISAYGELRDLEGNRQACPFRWPGQYEDAETGLYYNRFRYYDPETGGYISQDPIGLDGGPSVYAYVHDPNSWTDIAGLAGCKGAIVLGQNMGARVRPAARAMKVGWFKLRGKKWTWTRNRKFLNAQIRRAKAGKVRILDVSYQKSRYHGPHAIYTRETQILKRAGMKRVPTNQWVKTKNGKRMRVHEWVPE